MEAGCFAARPISIIAEDDKLLLKHGTKIALPWMSFKDTIRMFCLVDGLIRTLQSTDQVAREHGLTADDIFLANLEHILLCLKANLMQLIISRTWTEIAKYLVEWQTERRLKREDWFFEFPNALHPLSTTWPWGIRPSLAVIWGVCWMFMSEYGYYWDEAGYFRNVATGKIVLHMSQLDEVFDLGTLLSEIIRFEWLMCSATTTASATTPKAEKAQISQISPQNPSHPWRSGSRCCPSPALAKDSHLTLGVTGIVRHPHNNGTGHDCIIPAQPRYVDGDFDNASSLPAVGSAVMHEFSSELNAASLPIDQQGIRSENKLLQHEEFPGTPLPRSAATLNYQAIRKPNKSSVVPEDRSYDDLPMHLPVSKDLSSTPEDMSSDQQSNRRDSIESASSLSTTASQHLLAVKREDSDLKSTAGESQIFKSPSLPRRPLRPEPTVRDGKIVCTICTTGPFERKCEWNKHMDKHDRPYRCLRLECVQLQGFTYSGGLLRHEREVHGLHGGPKTQLYCPVATCKRHSQKEFTRKENLAEHMRRVHKGVVIDGSNSASTPALIDLDDEFEEGNAAQTPSSSKVSDIHDLLDGPPIAPGDKRKRSSVASETDYGRDVLQENKRLKLEIAHLKREREERDVKIATISQELEKLVRVHEQGSGTRP